jgi:radical SAM superfamily enzyme YgiQ (UPF0313 family)
MKVGLIQLDGKMPNLALMKLSAWHKNKGDDVTVLDLSNLSFDRVYASKVFVGGSGYDLKSELPPEIEALTPDYEQFKTEYSIGFTSRGCIRDCGFCIVREKEGAIREAPFDWVSHHKVIVLDNNFLASPCWREKLEYFIRQKLKVNFNQGLDIRLINEENAKLLSQVKYYDRTFRNRRLYFAFDDPRLENVIWDNVRILNKAGIPSKWLMFYVLVGYDTTFEEDYARFEVLQALGCLPFIMIYNNKRDKKLRDFSRWVNKRYYKLFPWIEYKGGRR